jgi:hypothetical protein
MRTVLAATATRLVLWTTLVFSAATTGCFPSFDGLSDGAGPRDAAFESVTGLGDAQGAEIAASYESGKLESSDLPGIADAHNPLDAEAGVDAADGYSPPKLLVKYDFDETSGVVVPDSSGNERHAQLQGTASWVPGRLGNALHFDGTTGYVTMPVGIIGQRTVLTFAMWVRLDAVAVWQRLFDFGKDANAYMFMTATDPSGSVRFAISLTGFNGEARIATPSGLPIAQWKHVALVLTANSAALYTDGARQALTGKFALSPLDLGLTQNDWIGRSQYVADTYLKGTIDDFRIYDGALSDAAIFALAHP